MNDGNMNVEQMENGKSGKGRSIGYEVYAEGLSRLENDRERELAEWGWGYYVSLGKNLVQFARELGLEKHTAENLLTGALLLFKESRTEAFDALAALKSRVSRSKPLVRTIVTQKILDALDYARDERTMVYISGTTGRGKTYAAEYWAAQNNHGRTKFLRAVAGCTKRTIIRDLARSMGIGLNHPTGDISAMLFDRITDRNVIIVDEAGHLLGRNGVSGAIEFLRDLHDKTHCGVCLIFTDVYLDEIKNGRHTAFYEQFRGRFEFPVEIPELVRKDEVRAVVKAFVPDADEDFVEYALKLARTREGKLRTLFKDLYRAEDFAKSKGRAMTRKDLKAMVEFRRSGGSWAEDR